MVFPFKGSFFVCIAVYSGGSRILEIESERNWKGFPLRILIGILCSKTKIFKKKKKEEGDSFASCCICDS